MFKRLAHMLALLSMLTMRYTNCLDLPINYVNGYKNYTQLEMGNINILISIPHDGSLKPADIPDRETDALGNLKSDLNTRKIGQVIRDELMILFLTRVGMNVRPFVIYNNLHRSKMDPNRNSIESCMYTNDDCNLAYRDYHSMIEKHFKSNFVSRNSYKQSLLVDVHGQSHPENWIELGYLLKASQLDSPVLPATSDSSFNLLASLSGYKLDEIIRGSKSLGGIMQQKYGFNVVPSPTHPSPNNSSYYTGGYITQAHGSFYPNDYRVNAVQMELPSSMRSDAVYEANGKKIAACLFDFYWAHNFDRFNN